MVITDHLSKGVILEGCKNTETEHIIDLLIKRFYRYHGVPSAIISDQGGQFVSHLWKRLYEILQINQHILTAYHPETDGSTERANAEVEKLLRWLINHQQDDWVDWLPIVELTLNGRESASTGTSAFFLSHGYHLEPLQLAEGPSERYNSPEAE